MVDMTWGGWDAMEDVANANGFPYVRIDASNHQFIKVLIYSIISLLFTHGLFSSIIHISIECKTVHII